MNDDPDARLLRRYLNDGDEAAFADLVKRYLGLVYHAALRQSNGDGHAAEEITQTVFTLVAQKATSLVRHETLAGWLHTTTRYTAHCHRRRETRRVRREEEARIMHEDTAVETNPADWERLRPLIDDVLTELKAADRDAILLRFFNGLSLAEIGSRLNVSENAARMRVERALEKLHTVLARRGVASTATALGAAMTTQALASAPAGLAASVTGTALSSTASGALIAAGIFSMKTKSVLLVTTLLIAVGTALFQFNEAKKTDALLAAATRERDVLRTPVRMVQPSNGEFARNPAALPQAAKPATRNAQTGTTPTTASPQQQTPILFKIANVSYRRVQSLDAQYQAFYRSRGFNAEQSERFKALLVENAQRNEALMKAAVAQNSTIDPATQRAIDDQTNTELTASIRAAFGDAAVQALEHYETTLPLRAPVEEFAKTLFYTDTPLTAGQAEQLINAVASSERTAQGNVDLDWMVQTDMYGAMLTQASGILSPPQVQALRRLVEQSLEQTNAVAKKATKSPPGHPAPAIAAKPSGS